MNQFQKDLIVVAAVTVVVIAALVIISLTGKSGKPEYESYSAPAAEVTEQPAVEEEVYYSNYGGSEAGYHEAEELPAAGQPEPVGEPESADGLTDYSEWVCNTRLTDADINGMPKSELRILRNTIYARHGYIFKSADLREYFSKFGWYVPSVSVVDDLSDIEQHNVALIQRHE